MLCDVVLHSLVGMVLIRVEVSGHNLVENTEVFGLLVSHTRWKALFAVIVSICGHAPGFCKFLSILALVHVGPQILSIDCV